MRIPSRGMRNGRAGKGLGGNRLVAGEDQPSVRYQALTQLLEKNADDPEVQSARQAIAERGWAADILARQNPRVWWVSDDSLYHPKYLSTNWMLLILSDLGVTKEDPRIHKACDLWIRRFA